MSLEYVKVAIRFGMLFIRKLQIRADIYNATNSVGRATPDTGVTSTTFRLVQSVEQPQRHSSYHPTVPQSAVLIGFQAVTSYLGPLPMPERLTAPDLATVSHVSVTSGRAGFQLPSSSYKTAGRGESP